MALSSKTLRKVSQFLPENNAEKPKGYPISFSQFCEHTNIRDISIKHIKKQRPRDYQTLLQNVDCIRSQEYNLYLLFFKSAEKRNQTPMNEVIVRNDTCPEELRSLFLRYREKHPKQLPPVPFQMPCKFTNFVDIVDKYLPGNEEEEPKKMPVSFKMFCKFTNCVDFIDAYFKEQGLTPPAQSSPDWQKIAKKIYRGFYYNKEIRSELSLKIHPCIKRIKEQLLSFAEDIPPKISEEVNSDLVTKNIPTSRSPSPKYVARQEQKGQDFPVSYHEFLDYTDVWDRAEKHLLQTRKELPKTSSLIKLTEKLYVEYYTKPRDENILLRDLMVCGQYAQRITSWPRQQCRTMEEPCEKGIEKNKSAVVIHSIEILPPLKLSENKRLHSDNNELNTRNLSTSEGASSEYVPPGPERIDQEEGMQNNSEVDTRHFSSAKRSFHANEARQELIAQEEGMQSCELKMRDTTPTDSSEYIEHPRTRLRPSYEGEEIIAKDENRMPQCNEDLLENTMAMEEDSVEVGLMQIFGESDSNRDETVVHAISTETKMSQQPTTIDISRVESSAVSSQTNCDKSIRLEKNVLSESMSNRKGNGNGLNHGCFSQIQSRSMLQPLISQSPEHSDDYFVNMPNTQLQTEALSRNDNNKSNDVDPFLGLDGVRHPLNENQSEEQNKSLPSSENEASSSHIIDKILPEDEIKREKLSQEIVPLKNLQFNLDDNGNEFVESVLPLDEPILLNESSGDSNFSNRFNYGEILRSLISKSSSRQTFNNATTKFPEIAEGQCFINSECIQETEFVVPQPLDSEIKKKKTNEKNSGIDTGTGTAANSTNLLLQTQVETRGKKKKPSVARVIKSKNLAYNVPQIYHGFRALPVKSKSPASAQSNASAQ